MNLQEKYNQTLADHVRNTEMFASIPEKFKIGIEPWKIDMAVEQLTSYIANPDAMNSKNKHLLDKAKDSLIELAKNI